MFFDTYIEILKKIFFFALISTSKGLHNQVVKIVVPYWNAHPSYLVIEGRPTEYTQSGNGRFLAYISLHYDVKLALAGEGGGCTPIPFHSSIPSHPKLQCTLQLRGQINSLYFISILYKMYSVGRSQIGSQLPLESCIREIFRLFPL